MGTGAAAWRRISDTFCAVKLLSGKAIVFVPFGIALFCQPMFSNRVASRLSDIALSLIEPVDKIASFAQNFDPFAVAVSSTEAVVVAELETNGTYPLTSDASHVDSTAFSPDNDSEQSDNPKANVRTIAGKPKGKAGGRNASGISHTQLPSLRVSESVVLRLAQSGRRPTGKPVAASGSRPAGIQVFGATALGIGVRDGDVLTQVSGVAISSIAQVVGLVIAARGAHQPAIEGVLYRGTRKYVIVVEQPYPPTDGNPSPPALG